MAESSQKEISDFEDEGILPIMEMLNFKIVKLDHGDVRSRDDGKLCISSDEKYYAGEYCRLSEQVQQWKSACETKENKVYELKKKVERLKKENGRLNEEIVKLKEVESIMEEQQIILEAMEQKQKSTDENFEIQLEEEKRKVELKDSMIVLLETKLRTVKQESEKTEEKFKDLSDFLIGCNNSLDENINGFVNEFNLTCDFDDAGNHANVRETNDDNGNEQIHSKLERNLTKLFGVVRKTFSEILSMGNEDNARQSINNTDKKNKLTSGINACESQKLETVSEDDDLCYPVCSPVTPEQPNISDF